MEHETKTWRIIDLIKWSESYFSEKGFSHPRRDIERLLQDLLNCSRVDLYLRFDEPLDKNQLAQLRGWVKRRSTNEPVQYITGKTEFYGLDFIVNKHVLIPRPETERLVDVAIHLVEKQEELSILDIGTGSGCIALALAHEIPQARITAIDIDDDVLSLAEKNAANLGLKNIQFKKIDILSESPQSMFDMIVCNPPYVPQIEMNSLMEDVLNFEPHFSLTDFSDGLTFYRRLSEIGTQIITPGGWMILEVGLGEHPEKAKQLFPHESYPHVELISDYNGDPRVLKINRGEP